MKQRIKTLVPCLASLWVFSQVSIASADIQLPDGLSARWQQWALSIPTPVNPTLDTTGADCMVGQQAPIWFLAGTFGGGNASRTCALPDDKWLFFPVVNSVNFNTPNVCGQGPGNLSVKDLRNASAQFVNGTTNLKVELDGQAIHFLLRLRSDVFAVALPEDNVFDSICRGAGLGNVPAGVFSPALDDGYYVLLPPLRAGTHKLDIHAENPSQSFVLNVHYALKVVAVAGN